VEYTVLLKLRSKKPKPKPPTPKMANTVSALMQNGTHSVPPINYKTYSEFPSLQQTQPKSSGIQNNGVAADLRKRSPPNEENLPPHGPNPTDNPLMMPPQPPQHLPPPHPLPLLPPPPEKVVNKYELAAKKIEKFTSAVIPSLFIIFNFIYWPWLIESANYYDHHKTSTVYHAL